MGRTFEHRLQVRYGETDQMGIVYHGNYLVYMEEGRTRMMAALGASYAELERSGVGLAVRKAAVRYRAPARYDETLVVQTRLERLGGASVLFSYEILREDGTRLADGSTELACIDLGDPQRGVRLLPEDLRAQLESALEPEDSPPAQAGSQA